MSEGLNTTLRVLTETSNEAALGVLVPALDSPQASIQEGALIAILARRSPAGGREILRRLHTIPEPWKELIRHRPGRLTKTLRDAVLGSDPQMCANACQAAVWFREYDLIPTLLSVLEDPAAENYETVAETLQAVAAHLYDSLAGPRDYGDRRDPQLIRRHVVAALESSAKRFNRHKRRDVIEAFLQLVAPDNVTLKQILRDPHHPTFLVVVDVLSHSPQKGVIRLLLSFLDDPRVPSSALSVVANRSDLEFVRYLLRKIGREPSAPVAQNLKRIESFAWIGSDRAFLDQFDDAAQHETVQLVIHSAMPRLEAFSTIEYLLEHGTVGGRREAAATLAEFSGAKANAVALRALSDADPQVQANIVRHVRRRGIPGILPRLLKMVESPHPLVRTAVQESLSEFSFQRFLRSFDALDEEIRHGTGMLVKKIDPQTIPLLRDELQSRLRTRRLRGLTIAQTIDAVEPLEETVIGLLHDEDHLVRGEAAAALGQSTSEAGRQALESVLADDGSPTVQEAAAESLAHRAQAAGR